MRRRDFLTVATSVPVLAMGIAAALPQAVPDETIPVRIIGETADWSREKWLEVIERNGWTIVQ